jgi:hypothetical protein
MSDHAAVELTADGILETGTDYLFKICAAFGAIALAYICLWGIAKLEAAASAISRTARCCINQKSTSDNDLCDTANDENFHFNSRPPGNAHGYIDIVQPTPQPSAAGRSCQIDSPPCPPPPAKRHHRPRRRRCAYTILSCEGFARVMLLFVRAAIVVGTIIFVAYIFGADVPNWITFPTFFAIITIGARGPIEEYLTGVSNAFDTTSLQGVHMTIDCGWGRKFSGRIVRMNAVRVILKDDEDGGIKMIPHSVYSNAVVIIDKDQGINPMTDLD